MNDDQFIPNTAKLVISKTGGFLGGLTAFRVVSHLLSFAVPSTLPARVVYSAGTVVLGMMVEYNVEKVLSQHIKTALDECEIAYQELDAALEEIMK